LKTLQVNLGLRCNLSCQHCHVNAGPKRTEQMERGGGE
jgi:MoaA/NifB/PqqE/SkfB family radical SAM enzyme